MEEYLEIEVKLACDNIDRVADAGIRLTLKQARHFEDNWLLDSEAKTLLERRAALRVRAVGGRGLITYKGPSTDGPESLLKVREEIEIDADDPQAAVALFERLGFRPAFRYQKYRTVYRAEVDGGEVEVTFDELPIGCFIEIEGDRSRVTRVMEAAGFTAREIIRESYPELQAARCRARGVPLEDLVF